jgi:hypothetical protein
MKKFIFGLILGLVIAIPVGAHGEVVSMIGKAIEGQFNVTLNGTKLDTPALVVDGTSYLPVRAIGEALGLDVKFDSNLGIELKQKNVESVANGTTSTTTSTETTAQAIERIKQDIKSTQDGIANYEFIIKSKKGFADASSDADYKKAIYDEIAGIQKMEQDSKDRLIQLQAQLDQLQQQQAQQ